jgi:hypothetical protein
MPEMVFAVLRPAHHAEKLHLRALIWLEDRRGGLDGFFVEDEDRRHAGRINGRMADGS